MYTEVTEEVIGLCKENNHMYPKVIGDKGVCTIAPFIFTVAIVVSFSETGYSYRYCYPNEYVKEALIAFHEWDGTGHPKGRWLKCKGEMELINEDYPEDESHPNWIDINSEESIKALVTYVK
jgi:hypothetical protein